MKNIDHKTHHPYPIGKIGIIGGGQLGKMLAQKAKQMGFYVISLDPHEQCPASAVSDEFIHGDFYNEEKLTQLVSKSDITTYEIEHINTSVLKKLFDSGHAILPSPYCLEIIQDKYNQKLLLHKAGLPVPKFDRFVPHDTNLINTFGYPFVLKATKGGYDGRGVFVINSPEELTNLHTFEAYIEELVDIKMELAVMVARNHNDVQCYSITHMVFDNKANILDYLVVPADIDPSIEKQAKEIAIHSVECIGGIGVFGVELFLSRDNNVYVNEIAPRPHNSGHFTIEACVTSQYEQHLRAVCGFPLGSTKLLSPAVMINLLGESGYKGAPVVEGLHEVLSVDGASFHLYGKKSTSPYRKMGHVTILDQDISSCIEKAKRVKELLKIKSEG